ncbi:MAG: SIR2 family protein, partial [Proteobacteria bacterium]|nr:SIR2 family protein [Pseudomonadota bacterium]
MCHNISAHIASFIKQSDYKKAAKGFHDLDSVLYRKSMLKQIDPPNYRGHPSSWYRYIALLCAPIVTTTNWDNVIEDATSYRRMHWLTDPKSLLEQRQSNRTSVFHVHGHIEEFNSVVHTLDDYKRFNESEGDEARRYLGRLAEEYSFLIVGYSLEDPFITDICNDMSRNWNARPDFYKLEPNPSDEDRHAARDKHELTLVPYDKESTGSHSQGIDAFFGTICDELELERPSITSALPLGVISRADDLVEIDEEFLKSVQPPSSEALRRFYRGSPGNWAPVVHQKTARRAAVDRVLKVLETELGVALIGAGGEGKSTILKQIAIERKRQGWKVLFAQEASPAAIDTAFAALRQDRKHDILLCIDQADSAENLVPLLRFAENRRNSTTVVLACREYQWSQRSDLDQLRSYVQTVPCGRLNQTESREIANLLIGSGALVNPQDDVTTLTRRLQDESNNFLLAAMLYATEGRPLKAIIASVIDDIKKREQGDRFLTALAVVSALEVRKSRTGRPFFCSQNLFKEVFSLSTAGMKGWVSAIRGEVSLTPRGDKSIETRHPRIASVISEKLFGDGGYLDELEILENILGAAGSISRTNPKPGERKLLGAIPDADRRAGRDIEHVRKLYAYSTTADPSDAPSWQAWALMEKEAGEIETARGLFEKATQADPSDAPSWQAWALMEVSLENYSEAKRLLEEFIKNCGRVTEAVMLES